jgi:hypothetical protein
MNRSLGREVLFEILTSVFLVGVVVFFWRTPFWAILLLGVGLSIQLWFWGERPDAVVMVGAALLGTPSEIICVKYGVWSYRAPGLVWGIPVWIPLIWASLFCLFRRISMTILGVAQRSWPDSRIFWRRLFFGLLGAAILTYYVLVALTIIRTIAAVYSFFMLLAVIFWHKEKDILIFIVAGILGTFGEYICMKLGFWEYHFPFFRSIGLPISLPMAWGLSGVVIGRIARIWEAQEIVESIEEGRG